MEDGLVPHVVRFCASVPPLPSDVQRAPLIYGAVAEMAESYPSGNAPSPFVAANGVAVAWQADE